MESSRSTCLVQEALGFTQDPSWRWEDRSLGSGASPCGCRVQGVRARGT